MTDTEKSTNTEEACAKLQAEEPILAKQVEELKAQVRAVTRKLRVVRTSIKALSGDSASSKPTLGEEAVLTYLRQRLSAGTSVTKEELQSELLERARVRGCTGTGVHLVLGRLLKTDGFVKTQNGYTLNERPAQSA